MAPKLAMKIVYLDLEGTLLLLMLAKWPRVALAFSQQ